MPEQTRVKRPRRWEDVAGIGPTRAKTLRQEVGRFDGTFTDIRDTRDQREILSRSTSGTANQLPDYAENAVQAARDPSPDVVDGSLVETREVDPRTAQTRSRTTIRREAQQDDRRGQGFETMQRDPEELDRAAERFRDEFDDPFDVPAADIGRTAREELPDDRATSQPLINTAGSRTLFRARDAGDGFRQELERQTENIDRATASPGELADAFVSFVDDTVGLSDPQPRGVFSRGVRKPTDIGRTETGRFDRPDTDPAVDPQPIARDKSTGRFALDPFDIGASLGGLGSTDEQFGGGVENRQQFDRTVTVGITPSTIGDGFQIQTDDDRADRTLGRGSEVVERADQEFGLPEPGDLESTDVVAEAEIGFQDRSSGFGETAEVIETRETDDTIFSFR